MIGAIDGERDGEVGMGWREQRPVEKQGELQTAILGLLNALPGRVWVDREPEVAQVAPRDVA